MKIVKIDNLDIVYKAFDDVKDVFPNLAKSSDLNDYLQKIFKFGKVYAPYDDSNGKYCGIAAVYMNDFETKVAYLTLIGISSAYRKNHLGTQLLNHCEMEAKNTGMEFFRLEVKKDNLGAIEFYKKRSFVFDKEDTDCSWFMIKRLL